MFRDGLHSFAPRKEHVVVFDDVTKRLETDLPRRYEVTVTYQGPPLRRRFTDSFTLDIDTYLWHSQVRRKDVHDVAVELEKLRNLLEVKPR